MKIKAPDIEQIVSVNQRSLRTVREKKSQMFDDLIAECLEVRESPGMLIKEPEDPLLEASIAGLGEKHGVNSVLLQRTMAMMEDTLKGWEDIEQALNASDFLPKKVEWKIEKLQEFSKNLRKQTSLLPEGHPLRNLADEVATFSYVESVKWKRGDYL